MMIFEAFAPINFNTYDTIHNNILCTVANNNKHRGKSMKTTVLKTLDQIIEDPRKTKAVLKWLEQHGMLDETMIAMWEIEQNNKEVQSVPEAMDFGSSDYV